MGGRRRGGGPGRRAREGEMGGTRELGGEVERADKMWRP